ncbi:MAG: hypothetical protein JWQ49_234 [Edaphobacter sp.]|nr:hypothetical protein [Edaphobacter sp.]
MVRHCPIPSELNQRTTQRVPVKRLNGSSERFSIFIFLLVKACPVGIAIRAGSRRIVFTLSSRASFFAKGGRVMPPLLRMPFTTHRAKGSGDDPITPDKIMMA